MGKYIRKDKTTGEVAVMEVSQSSLGVRTRAKTLALQRLQKSPTQTQPSPASSGSYLQLRSRRLEKPPIIAPGNESKRQKRTHKDRYERNPKTRASSRLGVDLVASASNSLDLVGRVNDEDDRLREESGKKMEDKGDETCCKANMNENVDLGAEEASFGENVLDSEGRERETTPCSLIRDPDAIRTPGSSTRRTSSAVTNRRMQNSSRRHIPTAREMDEFFTGAEEDQQREFVEKYNYDPVKDKPLPGRYIWEKLDP